MAKFSGRLPFLEKTTGHDMAGDPKQFYEAKLLIALTIVRISV